MEKKKAMPQSSSSSGESSSGDEDENEQEFVRSDRKIQKVDEKKVQKADEHSESEEEEDDVEGNDDDDNHDEIDGTQREEADENSSSDEKRPIHNEGDSEYDSETSSASDGKPSKPSHPSVVLPQKLENGVGHSGKKAPKPELPSRSKQKPEESPRKGKDKASKRERDEPLMPGKGSSKKQKKESSDINGKNVEYVPKAKDTEKVSKDKNIATTTFEKKSDFKKPAILEKPELVPVPHSSPKKAEGALSKKAAADKGKFEKKSVKDADAELAKGSLSPVKHKLFTGKDEIVFTTEILHDLQKGIEIPSKKSDEYWSELADRIEERMDGSWSKEKLCDKLKRMKTRYGSMVEKFNNAGERKFRNTVDQELFAMWDQIWGNGDATKADDTDVVKSKNSKALAAASPMKGGKASRNEVAAPVQDFKAVMDELEVNKDNREASESEESIGGSDSPKKKLIVTPMDVDLQDAHEGQIQVPEKKADNAMSHAANEVQGALHKEVRATLAEIQESSRQTLKDWQTKALAIVENAVKAVAHQARFMNGLGPGGFDGLCTPFRSLDMRDFQLTEGNEALQRQWHDLQLKEIDVYRQRLELMQRECQLKQDQMTAQTHKKK
ncbi:hypothetical protein L7F22_018043 [Adiantum nelumboides]|nr:hypothetical protein [Adiantum nelumboides]